MYGFVLVPDCTMHFINVLIPSERSERGKKFPDRFALTFLVLPCF